MSESKHYTFRKKPSKKEREILSAYPEFVQELLVARNITTVEKAENFFNPKYDQDVHDPFLLKDMDVAVDRIFDAFKKEEHIAIYSDFDADGIPGGALLHDLFKKVKHKRFTNYIPHRDSEGYGFHAAAVDTLKKKGVSLIITVDVGISDKEAVAHAKELGIDTIITDHHIPNGSLPDAVAVINPQRDDDETYPFKHLCGSGVAFKLAQALLQKARELDKEWVADIPEGWEKWLLDLVAIATVADMMPLVGENRALVHYGLLVLRKSQRPGIRALCKKLGVAKPFLTEDDIGFSIAPRLNAASRMDSPEKGFELLTTDDDGEAANLAKELDSLNNKRKAQVASIVRELNKRFEDVGEEKVLVAGNPKWNPALLGLAANSFVDTHSKTICLWGREGTGNIKGSCRGDGGVNIVEMLEHVKDSLTHFGGHAHAGGFSVEHENVHTLQAVFNKAYTAVAKKSAVSITHADAELVPEESQKVHRTLTQFAPFGIENPKPIFVCRDIEVRSMRQFGKEEAHIELRVAATDQERTQRAIAFFKRASSFTREPVEGKTMDMLCTLELSRFAGRTSLELRIVDIV